MTAREETLRQALQDAVELMKHWNEVGEHAEPRAREMKRQEIRHSTASFIRGAEPLIQRSEPAPPVPVPVVEPLVVLEPTSSARPKAKPKPKRR